MLGLSQRTHLTQVTEVLISALSVKVNQSPLKSIKDLGNCGKKMLGIMRRSTVTLERRHRGQQFAHQGQEGRSSNTCGFTDQQQENKRCLRINRPGFLSLLFQVLV